MKIRIKKFKELRNVEFSQSSIIEGKNGTGKTTLGESFYFCLFGKKSDKSDVGGEVYSEHVEFKSDLYAEVEIVHKGVVFNRFVKGSEKNGEFVKNINTTLTITENGKTSVVTVQNWNEKVKEIFGEDIFEKCNPYYFTTLKKSEQLDFIFKITDTKKYDEDNLNEAAAKVTEQKKLIHDKEVVLKNLEIVEPAKIEDLQDFYSEQEKKINQEINKNQPKLTEDELKFNAKINAKISELENSEFSEQEKEAPELLEVPELNLLKLESFENLHNEVERYKKMEFNEVEWDQKIERAKANEKIVENYQKIVENYDNLKYNGKCTICGICDKKICEFKEVDLMEIDFYINAIAKFKDDKNHVSLEVEKEEKKTSFYQAKKERISGIEKSILEIKEKNAEIEKKNAELTKKYNEKVAEIELRNADLSLQRIAIFKANAEIDEKRQKFEQDKKAKILELKKSIKQPTTIDNSELYAKLAEIKNDRLANLSVIKQYNQDLGVYKFNLEKNEKLTAELVELKNGLLEFEAEKFKFEKEKREYYEKIEKSLNKKLAPAKIEVKLLKRLISKDEMKVDFSLTINEKFYNSNGESLINKIKLCQFFQDFTDTNLPIICDEVAILDEKHINDLYHLYENSNNIVILAKSLDKNLTITNKI